MEMGKEGFPGWETGRTKTECLKAVPPLLKTSPLENKLEGPDHGGLFFCLVKDFILHPEGGVEPFRLETGAGAHSCC